jgi:hypothetical protein
MVALHTWHGLPRCAWTRTDTLRRVGHEFRNTITSVYSEDMWCPVGERETAVDTRRRIHKRIRLCPLYDSWRLWWRSRRNTIYRGAVCAVKEGRDTAILVITDLLWVPLVLLSRVWIWRYWAIDIKSRLLDTIKRKSEKRSDWKSSHAKAFRQVIPLNHIILAPTEGRACKH